MGAAYDLFFAVAILGFAELAAQWLQVWIPEERIYYRLNGVFLIVLAMMYLVAAVDPRRYEGILVVASAGRCLGATYLMASWSVGADFAFLLLALVDAAFSLWHFLAWRIGRAGEISNP